MNRYSKSYSNNQEQQTSEVAGYARAYYLVKGADGKPEKVAINTKMKLYADNENHAFLLDGIKSGAEIKYVVEITPITEVSTENRAFA